MSASPDDITFDQLSLPPTLLTTVKALGYTVPTPVQAAAIPALLEGRDVLAQAATGTGKTAAFALPMIARLDPGRTRAPFEPKCLVLVPTRELAMQVTEAMKRYGANLSVSTCAIYGGEPIGLQLKVLKRGVDVVVATPGRAIDHLERGTLKLGHVKTVVLDEADEMLDMGFEEDLKKILDSLPAERQTALFSATIPTRIQKIAEKHLRTPVRLTIKRAPVAAGEAPKVRQVAYVVQRAHKVSALVRVLQAEDAKSALVFCTTRLDVDQLAALLPEKGLSAEALHGGLDQSQRDRVMKRFKSGAARLLIATDVAARGLDIDHLSLVVNYEPPKTPEIYVHRIGRTGRAGREGVAITLFEPNQVRLLKGLERTGTGAITVAPVPTAEQLDAQRLAKTKALVLEAARNSVGAELKGWAEASGIDVLELGAAAVMLLHREHFGGAQVEPTDIPVPRRSVPKEPKAERSFARDDIPAPRRSAAKHPKSDRPEPRHHRVFEHPSATEPQARPERTFERKSDRPFDRKPDRAFDRKPARERLPDRSYGAGGGKVTLFIGLGTEAGLRPADLVGAIANEGHLESRQIGPIQIRDRFALVGVPADRADEVVAAMRDTKIRGRKAQVRRERSS